MPESTGDENHPKGAMGNPQSSAQQQHGLWSRLMGDFDPEEETANFGTRLAVESREGALFDVVTLALFEPDAVVDSYPVLCSRSTTDSSSTAVALGRCLHVVAGSDGEGGEALASVVLADRVDCLTWSGCGRFVLCGLGGGRVQMLHLPTGMPLPAMAVAEEGEDRFFVHCQFESPEQEDGGLGIRMIGRNAKVYVVRGVDLEGIHSAMSAGDVAELKVLQSQMSFQAEAAEAFSTSSVLCATTATDANENEVTVIGLEGQVGLISPEGRTLSSLLLTDYLPQSSSPSKLLATRVLKKTLLCLDDSGAIHVICLQTMMTRFVWSKEEVLDIVLVEDNGDAGKLNILMTVAKEFFESGRALQMREFPSFQLLYELEVNDYCHPLDCGVNHETPRFVEGSRSKEGTQSLRMRGICESVLEARLQRLLKRQRFKEAEALVNNFKLPIAPLHQAKTTWLVGKLSPWRDPAPGEAEARELLQELKTTLLHITDLDYVVQCCLAAALPKLEDIRSLLLLARDIIRKSHECGGGGTSLDLLTTVSRSLQKLETFGLVSASSGGEDVSSSSSATADVDRWTKFSRSCMLEECRRLLRIGRMEAAALVWQRHRGEFVDMGAEDVAEMLALIPTGLDMETRLRWLSSFLPHCLLLVPECLPAAAAWAVRTVSSYETLSGRRAAPNGEPWPENGLKLARGVLQALSFTAVGADPLSMKTSRALLVLNRQKSDPLSQLSKLVNLIDCLEDLLALHRKLKLRLKLSDVLREDKRDIAVLVLDWCDQMEEIERVAEGFLAEYLTRFEINSSDFYAEYISDLIGHSESGWHWSLDSAPWEAKVEALLPHVTSPEEKADCILLAVRTAPIPWSQGIRRLCQEGKALFGGQGKAAVIKEEENLIGLKQIMKKYNCKSLELRGRELERLFQFMIRKEDEEGFRDALEVSRKSTESLRDVEIKILYLKHLLFRRSEEAAGDGTRATEILRQLESRDEQREVGGRIASYCEALLDLKGNASASFGEDLVAFLSSLEKILRDGLSGKIHSSDNDDLSDRIDKIKKSVLLWREFSISAERLRTTPRKKVLEDWLKEHIREGDVDVLRQTTVRLCRLLDLNPKQGSSLLVRVLSDMQRSPDAALVAKEDFAEDDGGSDAVAEDMLEPISSMTRHLLEKGEDGGGAAIGVLRPAKTRLAARCPKRLAARCAKMCLWHDLTERAVRECDVMKQQQPPSKSISLIDSSDAFVQWRFEPLYADKGLPPDREVVRRMSSWPEKEPNSEEMLAAAKHLMDCSHVELSLSAKSSALLYLSDLDLKTLCPLDVEEAVLLFRKSLGERRPDLRVVTAHLMCLSGKALLSVLKKASLLLGRDCSKLSWLGALSARICAARGLEAPAREFAVLHATASWGRRVGQEFGLDFKSALSGGREEREAVLLELIEGGGGFRQQWKRFSPKDLRSYCRSFGLDQATWAAEYTKVSLMHLEPKVKKGSGEQQHSVEKPDDFDEVLEDARDALSEIGDERALEQLILELLEAISPYNYEVLEVLLEGLEGMVEHARLVEKATQALRFLKQYTRVSDPSQKEMDIWAEGRSTPFPKLAKLRLPLTWLVTKISPRDRFKILRKEFTLDNFRHWCDVCQVLKLQADNICVVTVNNAVEAELKGYDLSAASGDAEEQQEWRVAYKYKDLTVKVLECVTCIGDRQKAASCAHFYVNRLPGGADKILAAEGFLLVTQEWIKECSVDGDEDGDESKELLEANQAFLLTEGNLVRLKTEDALRRRGLWSERYCQLVHQKTPEELICALFEDESIILRSSAAGGRYPDVSSAASEIAAAAALDMRKIKFRLLDQWLPERSRDGAGGGGQELDETVSNFKLHLLAAEGDKKGGQEEEDSANFVRCVYLAQDGDVDVLNYLLAFGFSESVSTSTGCKLRALRVLLSVADDGGVLSATSMSVDDVRRRLRELHFAARMESLNLPAAVAESSSSHDDGMVLVQTVLRTCGNKSEGLELAAELCLHFGVRSPSIWNSILEQMVRLDLAKELSAVLVELNSHPQLWHFPAFIHAWQHALLRPFSRAGGGAAVSREEREACSEALELLKCCPLTSSDLDLELLRGECRRVGLGDLLQQHSSLKMSSPSYHT